MWEIKIKLCTFWTSEYFYLRIKGCGIYLNALVVEDLKELKEKIAYCFLDLGTEVLFKCYFMQTFYFFTKEVLHWKKVGVFDTGKLQIVSSFMKKS